MLSRLIMDAPLESALARLARDEIDLNRRAERQRRHRHRGARGIRRVEIACIHRIHRGEILHVGEIHVHPCHIAERFADLSEERAEILQHLLRLRGYIAIDEPAGAWTQCHLSAQEQELARTHAGRKGTHWSCDPLTAEGFSRHGSSAPVRAMATVLSWERLGDCLNTT